MDFQFDSTVDGKAVKIASMIDEHTRLSLMNIVERSIPAQRLVEERGKTFALWGGPPLVLRMDNGPEFISSALHQFCVNRVGISYIPPGTPWNNGHIESFNNRLRKECLNRNHWTSLLEARVVIEDFKDDHNHRHRHGVSMVTPPMPAMDGSDFVMLQAIPNVDPSDPALETTLDALRAELPEGAIVGGAPAENLDLQTALNEYLPIVVSVILVLGFLLLLIALQAPLIALLGTVVSLLSTGAAFGVAKLIFQDGHGSSLLGFTPQGFLNGWGPVFFFAMIFAIAMDYTVFLLSSVKEHYENTGDPHGSQVDGMAHSGRVIFAAAAVMIAVFFSFALAEPLPPKEMGIILGVAVLLDAILIRLVLLPVLLRLTGHAAWWSPAWLRAVLPKIGFSHS